MLVARAFDPAGPRYADKTRWRGTSPGFARRYVNAVAIGRAAAFLIPAGLVVLSQWLFWQRVYAQPLFAAGPFEMRWASPQVLPFLFSTWQGAFVWSPLLLAGFVGLAFVPERDLRWTLFAAVALEIYTSAAVFDWWGSASFGARRLVVVAPFAALGLAHLLQRLAVATDGGRTRLWRSLALGLVALGMVWNVRLAQYNVHGFIPLNVGNTHEYPRAYPVGDPRQKPYRRWDYPRLAREFLDAERQMWGYGPTP